MNLQIIAEIAKNLKELRTKRGLSIAELAEKAGTTKQTISYLENCERTPSFETGLKIAQALGVTAEELAYGEKKNEENE
jgi:transcriptional regulator with XRE-family HTH domain